MNCEPGCSLLHSGGLERGNRVGVLPLGETLKLSKIPLAETKRLHTLSSMKANACASITIYRDDLPVILALKGCVDLEEEGDFVHVTEIMQDGGEIDWSGSFFDLETDEQEEAQNALYANFTRDRSADDI